MNVVFEDELLQEMRELVPVRQRSEFIQEAVRLRLAQLRQIRAVEAAAGAWSGEGRPVTSERRLRELPEILASLPQLSPEDLEAFESDLAEARSDLLHVPIRDPWGS